MKKPRKHPARKQIVSISLKAEEVEMANADARRQGMTRSTYLGQLIRAGHKALNPGGAV